MTTTQPSSSRFIPNSFQVPNAFVDELMPLLEPSESIVLIFMIRRIHGFQKDVDKVSVTQLVEGTERNGKKLDGGCGLSRPTVVAALKELRRFGIAKTCNDDERHPNESASYSIQLDAEQIDMAAIRKRHEEKGQRVKARLQKSQATLAKKQEEEASGSTIELQEKEAGSSMVEPRNEGVSGSTIEPQAGSTIEPQAGSTIEPPIERKTHERKTHERKTHDDDSQPLSSSSSSSQTLTPDEAYSLIDEQCDEMARAWLEEYCAGRPARSQLVLLLNQFAPDFIAEGCLQAALQNGRSLNYLIQTLVRARAAGKRPTAPKTVPASQPKRKAPEGETEEQRMARVAEEIRRSSGQIYHGAGR